MNSAVFDKNYKTLLYEYPRIAQKLQNIGDDSFALYNTNADAPAINQTKLDKSNFILLLGLPTADFLITLHKKIQPTTVILVIEKEPGLFYKIMRDCDISSLIEGWQVKFIIGAGIDQLEEEIGQYYFPADELYVIKDERSVLLNTDYYLFAEQKARENIRLKVPDSLCVKKYKFLIMVGTKGTGWPYIMQDVISALHKLGHSVRLIHSSARGAKYFLNKEIMKNKPDFIFLLDAIGLKVDDLAKFKVPYISWFFDNPFNWLNESFISDYYHIFVWDKTYVADLKKAGFRNVYYLPLAANPDVFYPREIENKYLCDISFAGSSLIDSPELNFDSDAKVGFIKLVAQRVCESPWVALNDILARINKEKGIDFKLNDDSKFREFELFIQNYSRTAYRYQIIEAVLKFNPYLYGDEGWRKIADTMGGVYNGRINNRLDLPVLYSSSRINLNITVPQLRDSYSHRAFEIPACEGFIISDYRPEAENFFEIGSELVCFHTKADLQEKIDYFLRNEKDRIQIARRAKKRVIEEHTYVHRLRTLISVMENK